MFHHRTIGRRALLDRSFMITLTGGLLFAIFASLIPRFLTTENVLNTLRQVSLLGILAVGMTFLLIACEIDISIGSMVGFLTVLIGILVSGYGWNPWLAMPAVIAAGGFLGFLTGAIVTGIGIPSFVVTLAGLVAYRSAGLLVSHERPSTGDGVGSFFRVTGAYLDGTVPWLVVWLVAIAILGTVALTQTQIGYHVFASGGDAEAARSWGIPVARVKIACFVLMGALCGLCGALEFGWLQVASPTAGTGLEFDVIAAVVLGGTALQGGRGSVYASLIGAIIIGMLSSGLVLLGLSQQWEDVATGALILFAASMDWLVQSMGWGRAPAVLE